MNLLVVILGVLNPLVTIDLDWAGKGFTTLLALATAVTTGIVTVQQTTVRTWKQVTEALRVQNGDLIANSDRMKQSLEELQAKVGTLEGERDVLKTLVTGEVHLVNIEQQLETHHAESMAAWARFTSTLESMRQK